MQNKIVRQLCFLNALTSNGEYGRGNLKMVLIFPVFSDERSSQMGAFVKVLACMGLRRETDFSRSSICVKE